ncbi:MAG: tryptophan 7-halogenase [Pseudomonadales bacterium]|nr:tryptophan 7-halogenase [Pseudomonadales bacterium]
MKADVAILGGGLAGLTLAIQLKQRLPTLDILVLERNTHPVPEATHKVGESSVEIAAEYFASVLGLKPHLTECQLPKFGFRFFFSDRRLDFDQVTELGPSRHLAVPSYQIDRGIFENFLGKQARELGVRFLDAAVVSRVDVASAGTTHRIAFAWRGSPQEVECDWLIDASGRAQILKRRLGLQRPNGHNANAVWFRIGAKVDIDEWSQDDAWRTRCQPRARWLSTNHLVGDGYWVWLIPLASGSHSVGIVADARLHPLRTMNSFARAMQWLTVHQPRLAQDLKSKQDLLQDFAFFKDFSYGCSQVFSSDRWAITGEAGIFLDPFYSPGSDFIAISNTFITDLIAKDTAGIAFAPYARLFERMYFSFYDNMLPLYQDQYRILGDPRVLPVKVLWDYTFYWGVLCQLFYQRRLTDLAALGDLPADLGKGTELNIAVQRLLRVWSLVSVRSNRPVMLDQAKLAWFAALNRSMLDQLDAAALSARIRSSVAQLRVLAVEILQAALADDPSIDARELQTLLQQPADQTPAAPTRLLFAHTV